MQASKPGQERRNDGPVRLLPSPPVLLRAAQREIPQLVLVDGQGFELPTIPVLELEVLTQLHMVRC